MDDLDPATTNPDNYRVIFENGRVRVLEYRDVEVQAGTPMWLPAQEHLGENIGDSPSHALFVELKEPAAGSAPAEVPLGPT